MSGGGAGHPPRMRVFFYPKRITEGWIWQARVQEELSKRLAAIVAVTIACRSNCRTELGPEELDGVREAHLSLICPYCGNDLLQTPAYCPKCGINISLIDKGTPFSALHTCDSYPPIAIP